MCKAFYGDCCDGYESNAPDTNVGSIEYIRKQDAVDVRQDWRRKQRKTMTNRERLEKMTDEELAEFICEQHTMCVNCIGQTECCTGGNGALAWLKAEAEEEDER